MTVRELVASDEWAGGDLIMMDNEIARPTSEDCINNYIWLKPFAKRFPQHVCSGYYAADVFLALNTMLDDKLLRSSEPSDTKKALALHEGSKLKRLMGGLRYLWRSSCSAQHSQQTVSLLW